MQELIGHIMRGVAQPGSAPPWGGGGRRFKSSRPDQYSSRSNRDFRFGVRPTRLMYGRRQARWNLRFDLTFTPSLTYFTEIHVLQSLLQVKLLTFDKQDSYSDEVMNSFCIFSTNLIDPHSGGL